MQKCDHQRGHLKTSKIKRFRPQRPTHPLIVMLSSLAHSRLPLSPCCCPVPFSFPSLKIVSIFFSVSQTMDNKAQSILERVKARYVTARVQ